MDRMSAVNSNLGGGLARTGFLPGGGGLQN